MYSTDQKKEFLKLLEMSLGVVSPACEKFGIDRGTYYIWLQEDWFKEAVDSINEKAIDFTEGMMFQGIKKGDTSLIKYYLSTKGKKRGYVERQEVQHDTPTKLVIEHVGNCQQVEGD